MTNLNIDAAVLNLGADLDAQTRGFYTAKAEQQVAKLADSGKLARKAARRARKESKRTDKAEAKQVSISAQTLAEHKAAIARRYGC